MNGSRGPRTSTDVSRHGPSGIAESIGGATPATRRSLMTLLNSSPWRGGIARWECLSDASAVGDGPADAVVAIPED